VKELVDLLPNLGVEAKNVCFVGGTGGGWKDKLAWNPVDKLILKAEDKAVSKKITDFVNSNKKKLIIGYISYDFGHRLQNIPITKTDGLRLPDIFLLAFDNYIENVQGELKLALRDRTRSSRMINKSFTKTMSRDYYNKSFADIMNYIKSGHVYQINFTHRLESSTQQTPRDIFYRLAKNNRAPMMGYIEGPDFELLSMSPERFIKVEKDVITTTPIK
jgi:para-aminobenzoate synthetase component 1